MGWSLAIPVITQLIDRLFPDPQKAAEAKLEMIKMQQAGDFKELDQQLQINLAQAKVNEAEASSTDPFRAGWRPFTGWVCGFGLAYSFLMRPIFPWVYAAITHTTLAPMPEIDIGSLMGLLLGLLGLGGLRTYEKVKGKS